MAEVQTGGRLPIVGTAVAAWRDAFRTVAAMPAVAGIMFAILMFVGVISLLLVPDVMKAVKVTASSGGAFYQALAILIGVIQSVLMAPLAIATHRYVILGEVARGYAIEPSSPRYRRFVCFSILLTMMFSLPNFIGSLLPGWGTSEGMTTAWNLISFVAIVVIAVVAVRRAILFPAIAVEAPAATWSNARNDTKGHSWRVALVFFCVLVPLMVITIPLTLTLLAPPRLGEPGRILFTIISAGVHTVSLCAFAAAASHLFKAYASRLLNADGETTPASGTVS